MNLPESSTLPIQSFSRVFSDMSESYKIFWLKGVLDFVMSGKESVTFGEIIHQMITEAWYMVSEYHLNLGPMDTLEKLVREIQEESGLKSSADQEKICAFLEASENDADIKKNETSKRLKKYESTLTNMVPYRLQAPFLHEVKGHSWDDTKDVIARTNRNSSVIYHFGEEPGLNRTIHVQKEWMDYLTANQAIITGWINYNLVCYLQRRNPSVPGISDKLKPPTERKMLCAEEYKSYCAIWENEHIKTIFDKCEKEHVNSDEVREKLYSPGIGCEAFQKELSLIVKPSYQNAKNLGFAEWKYE